MQPKPLSLKELAERLSLSPATVSLVINRSHVADSIPQETKDRILTAARKYKYRPNFFCPLAARPAQLYHRSHRPGSQRRLFGLGHERG